MWHPGCTVTRGCEQGCEPQVRVLARVLLKRERGETESQQTERGMRELLPFLAHPILTASERAPEWGNWGGRATS